MKRLEAKFVLIIDSAHLGDYVVHEPKLFFDRGSCREPREDAPSKLPPDQEGHHRREDSARQHQRDPKGDTKEHA
jgi:hypothetical protein